MSGECSNGEYSMHKLKEVVKRTKDSVLIFGRSPIFKILSKFKVKVMANQTDQNVLKQSISSALWDTYMCNIHVCDIGVMMYYYIHD